MSAGYISSKRISLREAGFNEQWLQQLVFDNPSVLGLGELKAVSRERKQSSGGRLDFC
jgi:RecB family endonuclease NucS